MWRTRIPRSGLVLWPTAAVAASRSEPTDFTLSNHPANGKTVPKGEVLVL